ncbi:MAG: hemerythrin domain-containing protein [Defluviitaleaceae bacterium]|nr:hemerythrin domain-containing protein [Defluviitaleaceae bacterium]
MSVLTWNEEFASGFSEVDGQHRSLMDMMNVFITGNNSKVAPRTVLKFLGELEEQLIGHFSYEESLMQSHSFPMTDYHANLHKEMRRALAKVRNLVENHNMHDPYTLLAKICHDWLYDHVAVEDNIFFSFYKNRDYSLDKYFEGRKCEILTMDNKLLGTGSIASVHRSEIVIRNNMSKAVPLTLSQMVKISSVSPQLKNQTFMARVFFSTEEIVKLFNATLVQSVNHREHFRVATDLDAIIIAGDVKMPAKIIEISVGGLMVSAKPGLSLNDVIIIQFEVPDAKFYETCEIRRITEGKPNTNVYGLQFQAMQDSGADKLNKFALQKQASDRRVKHSE